VPSGDHMPLSTEGDSLAGSMVTQPLPSSMEPWYTPGGIRRTMHVKSFCTAGGTPHHRQRSALLKRVPARHTACKVSARR
jgi:hypothetical protein